MSAGADPVRVYWFWRRTLLDPNTDADRQLAASETLRMLQDWYPGLKRSQPPKDEGTGADLSNPWDFLSKPAHSILNEQSNHNTNLGQPVNWRPGLIAWVFSPEVPGRYCYVVGVAEQLCCVVADDPRLVAYTSGADRPELHIWVDRRAAHAPYMFQGVYPSGFGVAVTVEKEAEAQRRTQNGYSWRG